MRTCDVDDCDKPHRSRGLCSTHYNQAHQPNRHAKVTVACDYCGTAYDKQPSKRYAATFCSLICRDLWRIETGTNPRPSVQGVGQRRVCRIPATHPARWYGDATPVRYGNCAWCGSVFIVHRSGVNDQAYCGRACKFRARHMRRRGREAQVYGEWSWGDFMRLAHRFGFRCAYCDQRPSEQLQPDHVVPLSRGGANTLTNLLPSCMPCNADKRDLLLDEWNTDRARRGLPPRCTSWGDEDKRVWHLTHAAA